MRRKDREAMDKLIQERNELANRASDAERTIDLIASEIRLILQSDAVRFPVVEKFLDSYYGLGGSSWRQN